MNSHAEAPDPKSGVSANSTTPASEKSHSSLTTTVIKIIEIIVLCQEVIRLLTQKLLEVVCPAKCNTVEIPFTADSSEEGFFPSF